MTSTFPCFDKTLRQLDSKQRVLTKKHIKLMYYFFLIIYSVEADSMMLSASNVKTCNLEMYKIILYDYSKDSSAFKKKPFSCLPRVALKD